MIIVKDQQSEPGGKAPADDIDHQMSLENLEKISGDYSCCCYLTNVRDYLTLLIQANVTCIQQLATNSYLDKQSPRPLAITHIVAVPTSSLFIGLAQSLPIGEDSTLGRSRQLRQSRHCGVGDSEVETRQNVDVNTRILTTAMCLLQVL